MFKDEKTVLDRLESNDNVLNIINGDDNKPENNIELDPASLLDNVLNNDSLEEKRRGRGKELSYDDRAEIAVMGQIIGIGQTSQLLGVSTGQPSVYNKGKINHSDKGVNKNLERIITRRKNSIRAITTKKLQQVLEVVDDQSIENLRGNAIKATTVAMNLSRIVEKLEPKETNVNQTANFIIMQPPTAKESDYEVIDV